MRAFQTSEITGNTQIRVGEALLALLVAIAYGRVLAGRFKDPTAYKVHTQDARSNPTGRTAAGWLPTRTDKRLWLLH